MRMSRVVLTASLALFAPSAVAEDVTVLGSSNLMLRCDSDTGQIANLLQLSGPLPFEDIKAVASGGPLGVLYGITTERLYFVDPGAGLTRPAGPRFASPQYFVYGGVAFVVHPVTGVLRILHGTHPPGANPDDGTASLSLDPATLEFVTNDPVYGDVHNLRYAAGDPNEAFGPVVLSATYHPVGSTAPTLYGVDRVRKTLVRVGPQGASGFTAADDVVTTIGPLTGFPDTGRVPTALEALSSGEVLLASGSDTWSVDLATGALTPKPRIAFPIVVDVARSAAVSFGAAQPLVTDATTVSLDHRRRDADKVKVVGRIGERAGGWAGKKVQTDFGGIVREFTTDSRGRGISGRESFRVSGKPVDGVWKFTMVLRGDRLGHELEIGDGAGIGVVNPVVDLFVRDPADTTGPADAHRVTLTLGFRTKNGRTVANQ